VRDGVVGLRPNWKRQPKCDVDRHPFAGLTRWSKPLSEEAAPNVPVESVSFRPRGTDVLGQTRSAGRCRNRRGIAAEAVGRRHQTNDRVSELSKAAAPGSDTLSSAFKHHCRNRQNRSGP